ESGGTQEAAGAEMAEDVPPTVVGDNGVPGLGAAIEADYGGIGVAGDHGVHDQPLAFIAEIGADNDGRVACFHDVASCRSHMAAAIEQPGTWVTLLTGNMGNTFLVLFSLVAVVVAPVDPVGNAQRCPHVHRRPAS